MFTYGPGVVARVVFAIFALTVLSGCVTPSTMLINRDGTIARCATQGGIARARAISGIAK